MTGVLVPTPADWSAIAVETTLAATIVAVLITPFFRPSRHLVGAVALLGLLTALAMTWLPGTAIPRTAFSGLLIADGVSTVWRQILLSFVAGVVVLWMAAGRDERGDAPEFLTLLLSATLGLSLMGATSNALMLLLSTELASMPSYLLAGFRKSTRHAAEASLKYVLFGAVCTAAMIYGLSLLYGVAGTIDLAHYLANASTLPPAAAVGLVLLGVGLLFKLAAVPAHFWCPDVFEGATVDVAAFLSVASKGGGVVLIARLVSAISPGSSTGVAVAIALASVAVVTTTFGNLGALRQISVKRLLAYSSIAHAGYLLSAMAVVPGGLSAVMVYLAVYAVMNLGAFTVLAAVERAGDSDRLEAFNGLAARAPLAAAAMAICLVSMVGLPPAAGVLAKLNIMVVLAKAGGTWWIVVASVAINSVISLAYYATILRAMYLRPASGSAAVHPVLAALAVTCAIVVIGMLVFFSPLEHWAGASFFVPAR